MERLSIKEIEKMTNSSYVCTQTIKINDDVFGDKKKHVLEFDVFDGFAYCPDYKGKEYWMDFPRKKFIEEAKDMAKTIREYLNLDETEPILEKHIMLAYNTLHKNSLD